MYIAHGFNHWFPIDAKHIIVSFHTNKHVNAPPQCDPAGVVGGRLIEYSEAMSRECSTMFSCSVECSTVLSCSVGADLPPRLQILLLPPAALRRLPFAPLCRHPVLLILFLLLILLLLLIFLLLLLPLLLLLLLHLLPLLFLLLICL